MKNILITCMLVMTTITASAIDDMLVYFPPLGDAVAFNYEFDMSRVSIDNRDLASYISAERPHNKYLLRIGDDEARDKILEELERVYVESTNAYIQRANVVQSMHRTYNSRLQLTNDRPSRFKLRIHLTNFDEDGEHVTYVDILDQNKDDALINSFSFDTEMDVDLSRDFTPFFKELKKSGKEFGKCLIKIVQNANNRNAKAYLTL